MDLMTSKDASEKWGITIRRVQALCDDGKIPSAFKLGGIWVMPKDTPKPIDGRTKAAKNINNKLEATHDNGRAEK